MERYMNKTGVVWMVIIAGFVGLMNSCVSPSPSLDVAMVDDTAAAGVVIEVTNGADYLYDSMFVFIDDEYIGDIKYPEIKGYKLKNGIHTIYVQGDRNYRGFHKSTAIRFTINNDRHYFVVDGKKVHPFVMVNTQIVPVEVRTQPKNVSLIVTAINNSFNTISQRLPANSKIALINITSSNREESNFVLEELTVLFVNSRKFTIVDRQTLNAIRQERNFQLSGEVSDETIISIGNFTGADLVITGSISGVGEMRRLRLRALDVKSAEILVTSSEKM
jgi:hypothetical protein